MRRLGGLLLLIIIIILIALTLLCHIVAIATNYWLRSSNEAVANFLNIGLWAACFRHFNHPHEIAPKTYHGCHDLYSDYYKTIRDWLIPSWLVTCRVLAIISLILLLVSIVLFLVLLLIFVCKWIACGDDERGCCERCLSYATPIMFIVTGVFIMMTLMIFADNAFRLQCKDFWVGGGDPNINHLAFSWGFEVAACVFSFLSGGFIIWLVVIRANYEDER